MKLALTMEKFTFWNKDKEELKKSIKELLDSKHHLKLRMTTSTSLANDLYLMHICASMLWDVRMGIHYDTSNEEKVRVVVHLNPNYTFNGKDKSESDE